MRRFSLMTVELEVWVRRLVGDDCLLVVGPVDEDLLHRETVLVVMVLDGVVYLEAAWNSVRVFH